MRVQDDAVAAHEGVVDEPLHLHRTEADAAHVRVARDVVEIVDRRWAAQDGFQRVQPWRGRVSLDVRVSHHPRNPLRIDLFSRCEPVRRTRAERRDDVRQLMRHQVTADDLVVKVPLFEHLVVEEMTERSVPDVVQQPGDPQRLFNQCW